MLMVKSIFSLFSVVLVSFALAASSQERIVGQSNALGVAVKSENRIYDKFSFGGDPIKFTDHRHASGY